MRLVQPRLFSRITSTFPEYFKELAGLGSGIHKCFKMNLPLTNGKSVILNVILAGIGICSSLNTYSQHLKPGAYFSIANSYRTLSDRYKFLDSRDKKALLFNFGLSYKYGITKNIGAQTGIEYSVSGYDRNPIIAQPFSYVLKYRLNYLGVPTLLSLNTTLHKVHISFNTGVIHKFLISAKYAPYDIKEPPAYIDQNPGWRPPTKETFSVAELKDRRYNMYNPDLFADVKFGFPVKGLIIGLSPEFRYSLLKTTKQGTGYHTEDEHLNSYGLKLFVVKK